MRMAKQNKKTKKKQLDLGTMSLLIIIAVMLVAIVIVFISKTKNINGEATENITCDADIKICNENNQEWINENCECISYEGGELVCPIGYEPDGTLCRSGNQVTNQMQKCSKYKCEFELEK